MKASLAKRQVVARVKIMGWPAEDPAGDTCIPHAVTSPKGKPFGNVNVNSEEDERRTSPGKPSSSRVASGVERASGSGVLVCAEPVKSDKMGKFLFSGQVEQEATASTSTLVSQSEVLAVLRASNRPTL
jgi:hypothetical protein